ncbi:MAG: YidC/Oxa1 family membrane protein insertase [bacterium]|nr:YidC/Oxa1 family membrane protein insertase [bacterium]
MTEIIMTQYSGAILGPIAKVLGWIMNWVFVFLSNIGIENIGLAIILLTVLIYTCMIPLTFQQQKFSMMSKRMNPELQEIQKKYKGKKDQESQMKMSDETKAVYDKYGVSPTGSCLQIIIQFPILLALFRVINNIPAYVGSVKSVFTPLVNGIMGTAGYSATMDTLVNTLKLNLKNVDFSGANGSNYIIDALYSLNSAGWETLHESFPPLATTIDSVHEQINHFNYFLGLNISNSPLTTITTSFKNHSYLLMIAALLIPLFAYLTQVLNIKLMPQATSDDANDQMAQQMKTMNRVMPLFSLIFTFTAPVGLGIYWIASALVRLVQQIAINKYFDSISMDDMIEKNREKAEKKAAKRREKMGVYQNQIYSAASMNTKRNTNLNSSISSDEKNAKVQKAYETAQKAKNVNPNSLTAKANLVKEFNEKNNK